MIVMKFGGSSVKNAERISNVASIVKSRLSQKPIIVVSALGGITDLLIDTANAAREGKEFRKNLSKLKRDVELINEEIKKEKEKIEKERVKGSKIKKSLTGKSRKKIKKSKKVKKKFSRKKQKKKAMKISKATKKHKRGKRR